MAWHLFPFPYSPDSVPCFLDVFQDDNGSLAIESFASLGLESLDLDNRSNILTSRRHRFACRHGEKKMSIEKFQSSTRGFWILKVFWI
jgi:hypothetical protein